MAMPHVVNKELIKLAIAFQYDMDDQSRAVLVQEWCSALKDISDEHFIAALGVVKNRCQFFPKIADVRRAYEESSRSVSSQRSGFFQPGTSAKRGVLWSKLNQAALAKDSHTALDCALALHNDGVASHLIQPIINMYQAKVDGDLYRQAEVARGVSGLLPAPLGGYVRKFYEDMLANSIPAQDEYMPEYDQAVGGSW